MYVNAQVCECECTCVHTHVRARGGPLVSFLKSCLPCFFETGRVFHRSGTCRLDCWPGSPRDPLASPLPPSPPTPSAGIKGMYHPAQPFRLGIELRASANTFPGLLSSEWALNIPVGVLIMVSYKPFVCVPAPAHTYVRAQRNTCVPCSSPLLFS